MHQCAFDKSYPPTPPPSGHEIGEMNTADGTGRRKKKSVKRMEYNFVLGIFLCHNKNISVQIVNFSSFPFKTGGEKNTFFYNKICSFLVVFFFLF